MKLTDRYPPVTVAHRFYGTSSPLTRNHWAKLLKDKPYIASLRRKFNRGLSGTPIDERPAQQAAHDLMRELRAA